MQIDGGFARAQRPTLVPVYERNEDETLFWGVAAQMAVPVFSITRTRTLESRTVVRQKQVALQQLQRKACLEVTSALEQYDRARRVVEQFGSEGDEDLKRQLHAVQDLYEAGQEDLLRVYAARRQAFQVRMDRLEAINTLAQSAANLIESSGMEPEVVPLLLKQTRP